MKKVIDILSIILHVLELMRKYNLSKEEAAIATAMKFEANYIEVLEAVVKYLKRKNVE